MGCGSTSTELDLNALQEMTVKQNRILKKLYMFEKECKIKRHLAIKAANLWKPKTIMQI